jgi:hypothetical protein
MNSHHNFRHNGNGIGTVFGMVFFLLIVMLVFAGLMIVLNQNTGLEQATVSAKQFDLDRYTELQTISISNPQVAVLNSVVYISCTITNTGTLPAELVRLWIKDNTTDTVGNTVMSPSIILQPGASIQYFNSSRVANAGFFDMFSFWFISTRGNTISAYPNTNQLNGIAPVGTFPGVADMNSTYQTNINNPLQLTLKTTKPNQLIYVIVSYDDGNTLYPPTSTPSLTWQPRGTSLPTDGSRSYPTYGHSGDSILQTFYAIAPSTGPVTINIHSTADELSDYYCSALAFAISDVNTASPFDGLAQTVIGHSTMPQDTINTNYSNDFIIGAIGIDDLNPAITPGAGFGQIMPVQSSFGASGEPNSMPRSVWSEWAIMGDPRNNLPVNCTFPFTEDWAIIVDAVKLVVVPPTAPMSLSPSNGPIGQPVIVSGQGFAANSQIIATFDGSQIPFSFTTDGSGNIASGAIFTVPQGSGAGIKTVSIIDNKFNYASANFTVTTSTINVTPQSGPVGTTITVTGSNFIDNSAIAINFNGNSAATNPSTLTTTATGDFSATFVVPPVPAGNKTVFANNGVNSANTNFAVTPSITITPARGVNGTQVSIIGQGFAAQSSLLVTFDGIQVSTSGNAFSDATGSFISLNFIAQSPILGLKFVNVTDASGNFDNDTFKLVTLDHFTMDGYPSSITAGQSFGSNNVTITACDVDGYVLKGYVGQVYFSSSDGQVLLPNTFTNMYTFATADGGVHIFAGSGFMLKTAGSEILTVTDGTKSNSTTIVVNPATLDHFTINAINSPQVAGTSFSITINAKDVYENTVTSYSTGGTLSDLSGTLSPSVSGNFVGGVRVVTVTVTKNYSTDTISILASGKSGTSNAFTVNPGAIHHFTMTGVPASVTAGSIFGSVVVTAYDANNNIKTDYTGQVYFTSTDAQAVLPFTSGSKYMFTSGSGLDNGVHTFSGFALKTVAGGSKTITVTDGLVSLVSGSVTVGFASVDHFAVSGFTNPVVAGVVGSVTVTAQDLYGNTVTTYTGTVHITSSDGAAVLPADHALASGVYTFSSGVTLKTVGSRSITATDIATGLITGSQNGIAVTPAAIASFTIAGSPVSVSAGTSFGNVVITAYDSYGNVKTDFTGSVYFTSTDVAAVLPFTSGSKYTFVSGDLGVHTFAGFTLKTVGSKTITVTDATRSATSPGINVVPGSIDHFTFAGLPASVTAGSSFAGSVTVTAYDSSNNVKTDYVGSVYFTSTDSQVVFVFNSGNMYTFVSGDNGVHAFVGSGFVLKTVPSQTITVRDDAASKSSTSGAITVNPGVLDHFTVTTSGGGNIGAQTVYTPFSITITAYDANNNVKTDYSGPATLSDLASAISPTSTGTFSNGVVTLTVTISHSYSNDMITASGSGKTGQSNVFNVNLRPLALDGSTSSTGTNTISLTLTTNNPNDILYLSVTEHNFESVTSVTSTGLTWNLRATATNAAGVKVETWYAIRSTSGSTAITIVINMNGGNYGNTAVAMGITGADIANPFDGSYASATGSGTVASTSKTTNNANDFIIGALAVDHTPTIAAGSNFNLIATQAYTTLRENSAEYRILSATGTYATGFTIGQTNYWAMIVDAIRQAS